MLIAYVIGAFIAPIAIDPIWCQTIKVCGIAPDTERILRIGPLKTQVANLVDICRLTVINGQCVLWSATNPQDKPKKFHRSTDRGLTWSDESTSVGTYCNIRGKNEPPYRFAGYNADSPLYEFDGCLQRVSTDGGMSWKSVVARKANKELLYECRPISFGNHGNRVFLWATDKSKEGVWTSDNSGESFKFLTDTVGFISQSRADDQRLFGEGSGPFLERSDDGGKSWISLKVTRFMYREVFSGLDGIIRTWNQDGSGSDIGYPSRVLQIETDPKNRDIVYVLTIQGLFRSIDGGGSFVLLDFQADRVLNISRIACDPMDGRYLYAVVGWDALYRSDDWGCSWKRMSVPLK